MIEFIREYTNIIEVVQLEAVYQENRILISAECKTNSAWRNEKFTIAIIYKDWKTQGNYTYFKGRDSEREYKTVKPVLNAVAKWVSKINKTTVEELDIFWFNTNKILEETRRANKRKTY